MSDLPSRVRQALALPADHHLIHMSRFNFKHDMNDLKRDGHVIVNEFKAGATWERARTQALDAALADCVETLTQIARLDFKYEIEGDAKVAREALTRIERALGGSGE